MLFRTPIAPELRNSGNISYFLLCVVCLSGCLALCIKLVCMLYFSTQFSEMIIKFMNVIKQKWHFKMMFISQIDR